MSTGALLLNCAAVAAALYDGKILIWDIALADQRIYGGSFTMVIFAVVVTAAFTALPGIWGIRLALAGRRAALLVGLISLALSAVGFVILAAAFIP
jgi:hypothetical protein